MSHVYVLSSFPAQKGQQGRLSKDLCKKQWCKDARDQWKK